CWPRWPRRRQSSDAGGEEQRQPPARQRSAPTDGSPISGLLLSTPIDVTRRNPGPGRSDAPRTKLGQSNPGLRYVSNGADAFALLVQNVYRTLRCAPSTDFRAGRAERAAAPQARPSAKGGQVCRPVRAKRAHPSFFARVRRGPSQTATARLVSCEEGLAHFSVRALDRFQGVVMLGSQVADRAGLAPEDHRLRLRPEVVLDDPVEECAVGHSGGGE